MKTFSDYEKEFFSENPELKDEYNMDLKSNYLNLQPVYTILSCVLLTDSSSPMRVERYIEFTRLDYMDGYINLYLVDQDRNTWPQCDAIPCSEWAYDNVFKPRYAGHKTKRSCWFEIDLEELKQ